MSDQGAASITWHAELEAWLAARDRLGVGAEAEAERARWHERVAGTIAANRASLAEVLAWIVPRLEQRLGALVNRGSAVARAAVQETLALQDDLRFLRGELARQGAGDVWLALEVEHSWLSAMTQRLGRDPSAPGLKAELAALDDALREARAQRALGSVSEARPLAEQHHDLLELAELLSDCHGLSGSSVASRLAETRFELRARIEARVRALASSERGAAFVACARATLDHADEMLTALDDMPLERCAFTLELIRDDLAFTRSLAPDGAAERADTARWLKKLKTEERWYRRELKEKAVEERMVALFGARAVSTLETTILVLTLVVLGLITIELTVGVPARLERLFFTADAVICSVFLAEYALKIAVAPAHLDYARRHFLLDFLPSIPFGFLTVNLLPADYARAGRAARLLRLPALARYARALRPLVRMLRFVAFLMRGMDRLVRSQAWWLNVNIIFLEDAGADCEPLPAARLEPLERRVRVFLTEGLAILPNSERAELLARLLSRTRTELARAATVDAAPGTETDTSVAREVHFVRLVEALLDAQVGDVEAKLDRRGAERMRQLLSVVDRPVIRWLPVLGRAARGCRRIADPYECVAHAARALGTRLERWLAFGRGIADLYGVMTAPQLLDRLGTAIAKATQRPALRLLLIGCLFLLVQLIAQALGSRTLQSFASSLNTHLGAPILIFGLICLTLLLLGKWLQQISGEATETFRRVSEAQFASLIKELKRGRRAQDFALLQQRVLAFEPRCADAKTIAPALEHADEDLSAERADHLERVVLLYRDYQDAGVLHRSAVKMSEQLLGNLAIQNIYDERLEISRKEKKRLRKLDLQTDRFFSFGPHAWFEFITSSIAEQVAKLVLDYNRHCLPLDQLRAAAPSERQDYDQWRAQRTPVGTRDTLREKERLSELAKNSKELATTHFHSLHFLNADQRMDAVVGSVFGHEVLERLRRDRKALYRHIFGRYPYEHIPRHRRTVNLYDLYWDELGGGRIILLPFKLVWWSVRAAAFVARSATRSVRDLLKPKIEAEHVLRARGDLAVAYRKIFRMQRPLYLECAALRARFDPEYLGCTLPRLPRPPADLACLESDLARVQVRGDTAHAFIALRDQSQGRLNQLARRLDSWPEAASWDEEQWRSVCIAQAIDYRDAATLAELESDLRAIVQLAGARVAEADAQHHRRPQPLLPRASVPMKVTRNHLRACLNELGLNPNARAERVLARWLRHDRHGLRRRVALASLHGGVRAATSRAAAILGQVASQHRVWRQQLLTLRTLQTLTVLELTQTCDTVRTMGEYDA